MARGYEEKDDIPSDSPTLDQTNLKVILMMAQAKNMDVISVDVKAAFLQGLPLTERTVTVTPPPEAKVALRVPLVQARPAVSRSQGKHKLCNAPRARFCGSPGSKHGFDYGDDEDDDNIAMWPIIINTSTIPSSTSSSTLPLCSTAESNGD